MLVFFLSHKMVSKKLYIVIITKKKHSDNNDIIIIIITISIIIITTIIIIIIIIIYLFIYLFIKMIQTVILLYLWIPKNKYYYVGHVQNVLFLKELRGALTVFYCMCI